MRVHLISGLPGSGKTTYAKRLSVEADSVLFSLDRWLITAYGRYSLAEVGQQEHTRRVLACRDLIWVAATELIRRSAGVILDDGFFLREHRRRYVAMAVAFAGLYEAPTHDEGAEVVVVNTAEDGARSETH